MARPWVADLLGCWVFVGTVAVMKTRAPFLLAAFAGVALLSACSTPATSTPAVSAPSSSAAAAPSPASLSASASAEASERESQPASSLLEAGESEAESGSCPTRAWRATDHHGRERILVQVKDATGECELVLVEDRTRMPELHERADD